MPISPTNTLALFQGIGHWEMLIILVIGLLLFGKRLPEVGRSLGRGIVEFKRGIKGIEDEIDTESNQPQRKAQQAPLEARRDEPPALQPPTGETVSRTDPATHAARPAEQ